MSGPRVSVIMPLYNGETFVAEALESVWAQAFPGVEVIVVDDGSEDAGPQRVQACGWPVTLLQQPRAGPAAARNRGVAAAQGEFLAFIDADDRWTPGRLAWQSACLEAQPGLAVVQGQLEELHCPDGRWVRQGAPYFANSLCTGLFRRQAFLTVGMLDETLPYCEDVDWFFAAQAAGLQVARMPRVAIWYRRHDGNMTNRKDLIRRFTLQVVAKHRRRHGGETL